MPSVYAIHTYQLHQNGVMNEITNEEDRKPRPVAGLRTQQLAPKSAKDDEAARLLEEFAQRR